MKTEQGLWTATRGWVWNGQAITGAKLILCFGAPGALAQCEAAAEFERRYPNAITAACSTGGEIFGADVLDDSVTALAMSFANTDVAAVSALLQSGEDGGLTGCSLAQALFRPDLSAVLIFCDGLKVNGSALITAMREVLGAKVVITGGLAGDGPNFVRTLTGLDGALDSGRVCAVGLYGDRIRIGHGSAGGWDVFGPQRTVTRSEGNRLFELDGKPALALYKDYLGEESARLPGSALLFPLQIFPESDSSSPLVRTVVGIDEDAQAMIFAGDVPQGWCARLMRGNFDHLVHGAADAAQQADQGAGYDRAAILVSCIGRKLLMGQRIGEETEAVQAVLGPRTAMTGFYSYGEISPHAVSGACELHNQTMTITTLWEE